MLLPHWANIRVGEGLSWPPHKLLTPDMTRSAPAAPQFYTQLRFFSHAPLTEKILKLLRLRPGDGEYGLL
jgi:hypothetical protein